MNNDRAGPEIIDYDRYGPWDERLGEYVTSKPIILLIHNLNKDVIEREFKLDYGKKEDRQFVGKVSFWCLNNGRSTEILSVADWENMCK